VRKGVHRDCAQGRGYMGSRMCIGIVRKGVGICAQEGCECAQGCA
jgi:hypothetical protein